jgi:hypothetical protein
MKTRGWLVAAILSCAIAPFNLNAQCGTIQTVTYDTVITGIGASEDPYIFTFPLFNTSLGTLTDVNVSSVVTVNYNYDIENTVSSPTTFRLKITRADDIVSALLPGGGLSYTRTFPTTALNPQNSTNYFSHLLAGTDNISGSGADYSDSSLILLNNTTIINEPANTANFIGTGTTSFEYYSSLGNYTLNASNVLFNPSASDQITLSVTYTARPAENQIINNLLYPNPSADGNFLLKFHNQKRGDWQVEIFNAAGQLISRKEYHNSLSAQVNNKLAKGIYIIKATNIPSHENFIERLIVK